MTDLVRGLVHSLVNIITRLCTMWGTRSFISTKSHTRSFATDVLPSETY